MGAPDERTDRLAEIQRLADLDRRIAAARSKPEPKRRDAGDKFTAANMAWRMTLELVVGGLVGAAMGWGLDELFGTRPAFLIVFILLGFAAGVRTVMRSARDYDRRHGAGTVTEEADPPGVSMGSGDQRRRSDGGE